MMPRMSSLLGRIRRITIDNDARAFEIETQDGITHREEAAFPSEDPTLGLPADFRRLTYDPAERTVTLVPPSGPEVVLEDFDGSDQQQRRAGRPTIYLDQN